nr:MAG TPA: hypothetical protein [Caudoviricetes sp.]
MVARRKGGRSGARVTGIHRLCDTPIKFTCTHGYNRLLFSYRNERRDRR